MVSLVRLLSGNPLTAPERHAMIQDVADELRQVDKPLLLKWPGIEAIPIQAANQFLAQIDSVGDRPEQVILVIGQVTPPPLLGTEEQKKAQMEEIDAVNVLPLARYSLTPGRLAELIELLRRLQSVWSTPETSTEDPAEATKA